MSLADLVRKVQERQAKTEQRVNGLGQWHYGTVTVVTVSPPSVDVRLFREADEGSVVLTALQRAKNYAPVVGDYVLIQESGNGAMEDGAGAFLVHFAIA